jgi:hypothetical protein
MNNLDGLSVLRFIDRFAQRKKSGGNMINENDKYSLREKQLHEVGECNGESGLCRYCDEIEEKEGTEDE